MYLKDFKVNIQKILIIASDFNIRNNNTFCIFFI